MQSSMAAVCLNTFGSRFAGPSLTAARTFAQLSDEQLRRAPNAQSNSVAATIKQMSGNMFSRWTDFFETDGEQFT